MKRRNFIVATTSAIAFPYTLAQPANSAQSKSIQVSSVVSTSTLKVEHSVELKAVQGQAQLAPERYNKTPVWCYNGSVPGPEIRIRQGQRLRVLFKNELEEASTIHWHGVRTPNTMDGVPHLTQIPVEPESEFAYEFEAIDAGTFWYHPHQRSFEQVGRGLYGPLIVEEINPVRVDRDLTWVLDDWRLVPSAAIRNDFGNGHDMSHNGRIGNTVTINGRAPDVFKVQKGERIRLRLINAANARIFELDFEQHRPVVIALDGQPVDPHMPENGRVILGPAMRVDLILDMTGNPKQRNTVTDVFYKDLEYQLIDIQYTNTPLRDNTPDWSMTLPANPLAEPDLQQATRHNIQFSGGMMGQMVLQEMGIQDGQSKGMSMGGMKSMRDMMHSKKMWFINGVAAEGHIMKPMLTLQRNQHTILDMTNASAWYHPIHLHGYSFRVLSRNGVPTKHREWQDTVLMSPRERVEIAFVADNPGDWMFHCHILEHAAAGMMGVIRVT